MAQLTSPLKLFVRKLKWKFKNFRRGIENVEKRLGWFTCFIDRQGTYERSGIWSKYKSTIQRMRYDTLSTVGPCVKTETEEIWPYTDYENISISYLDLLKEDPCFAQITPSHNTIFSGNLHPVFNTDPVPPPSWVNSLGYVLIVDIGLFHHKNYASWNI